MPTYHQAHLLLVLTFLAAFALQSPYPIQHGCDRIGLHPRAGMGAPRWWTRRSQPHFMNGDVAPWRVAVRHFDIEWLQSALWGTTFVSMSPLFGGCTQERGRPTCLRSRRHMWITQCTGDRTWPGAVLSGCMRMVHLTAVQNLSSARSTKSCCDQIPGRVSTSRLTDETALQ